jgi:hypothetical protein
VNTEQEESDSIRLLSQAFRFLSMPGIIRMITTDAIINFLLFPLSKNRSFCSCYILRSVADLGFYPGLDTGSLGGPSGDQRN